MAAGDIDLRWRRRSLMSAVLGILVLAACQPGQGQGAAESVAMLVAAAAPPDAGPIVLEGRASRRVGVLAVPLPSVALELVQDDRVLASGRTDLEGRFAFRATVQNGTLELRLANAPAVRTRLQVAWTHSPFRDIELVAPE